jgi:hypothetical protein
LRSGILTEGKHRLIVAKELGLKQVPIKIIEPNGGKAKINWNLNTREGRIVYMPPEEYIERVNIFNRIGMSRVVEDERRAIGKGYRGIGYYPPLSEQSYRSILEGIRAGTEMGTGCAGSWDRKDTRACYRRDACQFFQGT